MSLSSLQLARIVARRASPPVAARAWTTRSAGTFASTLSEVGSLTSTTTPYSPSSPSSAPFPSAFALRTPPPTAAHDNPDVQLLQTLARLIMTSGQLTRAHSHLALMLSQLTLLTSSPPLPLLRKALSLTAPSIRIVQRRRGTKNLPTPQPLTEDQRTRQAWKWIVEASDKRQATEKVFGKRLALEVVGVLSGQSEALKKKDARHQQGVLGRANVPTSR